MSWGRPTGRRLIAVFGQWVNSLSYLPKWMLLASLIGAIAGMGAVLFYEALLAGTHLFLVDLAGYHVPTPAGEGGSLGSAHYARPWAIPLVVALGGLIAGFIVFTWAPEAEGHGTDAAIDAVHHNPRGIRLRAVVVKIVASAITIGSGGSGGREGPTAQISAGFGSLLARVFDLSPEDGRIAVSVGIGSGIGAIFSAPLGGAVLAAEIVFRDDFEYEALLPGTLASVIAYTIFGAFIGYSPLFSTPGGYQFHRPIQLLWFAVIGVVAGGIGLGYSKSFYATVGLSARLRVARKLRPAFGGLVVGLIALWLPEVLGTGYGWVQEGLSNQLAHVPLYIIVLLPLARIVATSASIGTGGSGGVFGPGMVIGAFSGLAVWRVLADIAPGVGHDPYPYVIVGMMAVFGAISRAPIAVMIMVAQMTGSIGIVGPAMVAVAIAWFIVGRADESIYRSQLHTRRDSASTRIEAGLPSLGTLEVSKVMSEPRVVLMDNEPLGRALERLRSQGVPGAPVVDDQGTYVGSVDADRLSSIGVTDAAESSVLVDQFVDASAHSVAADSSLDVGLDALTYAGGQWVTVTAGNRRVVGILSIGDLVRGYAKAVGENSGKFALLSAHSIAVEELVGPKSAMVGRAIRECGLPPGCVVMSVHRREQRLAATASTVIEAGDVLSIFTGRRTLQRVAAMVSGSDGEAKPTDGEAKPFV